METRNIRQPGTKRNQGNDKVFSNKEGASNKLSGLSIRPKGRAPLAEISTNRGTNSQIKDCPGVGGKSIPFQVYQDDAENSSSDLCGKINAKKQCLRTHILQTKENIPTNSSLRYAQHDRHKEPVSNQSQINFQCYTDENKPPPAKIPNNKRSPNQSAREPSGDQRFTQTIQTSSSVNITTSGKPNFSIHQDVTSPNVNSYARIKEPGCSKKNSELTSHDIPSSISSILSQVPTSNRTTTSSSFDPSKGLQHLSSDLTTNPNLGHILSRTSAAEFRNSFNDTIQSTSSPATDVYERDNDVFSLLQQNDILENETRMDDDTTLQEDNEDIVAGTSEDEEVEEVIERSAQAVSEAVLISEEYSEDILGHVKQTEVKSLPKWNYMTKQPDITFPMRSILVDWLVEVSEEYKLHTETVFLAVNYIDRFLSYMSVQRARLQLVGTACMFIAAKYEEIYPPDVAEFVYITDDTYTKKQVLRMEQLVLGVLEFNVTVPTAFFFANHFSKMAGSNDKTTSLARYLTELTLLDADTYLSFVPSIIGASAVALARHTLGFAAWDANMVRRTGYAVEEIRMCLIALHRTFSQANTGAQQAIVEKYKQQKHLGVSEVEPTPIF